MDINDIKFSPKEFVVFPRTEIDKQIEAIKINVPDEDQTYATFNLDVFDDIYNEEYLLKPVKKIQNPYSDYRFEYHEKNDDFLNGSLNMEQIIDLLDPLSYKGIRMNYNGNVYERKSQLTPINSLPKITYTKDKFTL